MSIQNAIGKIGGGRITGKHVAIIGGVAAVAAIAGGVYAVIKTHPDWIHNIQTEARILKERITKRPVE